MSEWFSNRGQVVQASATVFSAVLAAAVAMTQGTIPIFWGLAIVPIFGAASYLYQRQLTEPKNELAVSNTDASKTPSEEELPERYSNWEVLSVAITEGDRWKIEKGVVEKYEIKVRAINRETESAPETVEIEAKADLGSWSAGNAILQQGAAGSSSGVFVLPVSRGNEPARTLVCLNYNADLVRLFAIRVEHINHKTSTVNIETLRVSGYDHYARKRVTG